MFNPFVTDLMDKRGETGFTPVDLVSHITGLDASKLNKQNYVDFLKPDLSKERHGILEHFGMENYSSTYIANRHIFERILPAIGSLLKKLSFISGSP